MELSRDELATLAFDTTDSFRLGLAQALRHHDAPRAEFIQVQCALARAGTGADTEALRARANTLLAVHATTWLAALGLAPAEAVFARGFVDRVSLDVSRAPGVYARLVRQEPIRELSLPVDLGGSEAELPSVLDEIRQAGLPPSLERLTLDRRHYRDAISDDALRIRRQGPQTLGLSLDIDDLARPASGLDLLDIALASPDSAGLETLDLRVTGSGQSPTEALLQTLLRAGPRPSLREWRMEFASPNGQERIRWAHVSALSKLLDLYPRLQTLVLPIAELHSERIEHPELRELFLHWLGFTPCGPSDMSQWQRSPVPRGVGLEFLREAHLPRLERLGIDFQYDWYIRWSPEDLSPLLQAEGLPRLRHLELRYCMFGDALCHELVRAKTASHLEVLDLTGAALTDEGAHTLSRHRDHFPRLKQLIWGRDELSDAAWNGLVEQYPVSEPR